MASELWIWLVPVGLTGTVLLGALYRQIYLVGNLPAEQVLPSLAPLGAMGVHDLFSDAAERHLRASLTPEQFRQAQRHRVVQALEYVRRISHNALLLQQWAMHEMDRARADNDEMRRRLSVNLISTCIDCRMCSLVLCARLQCWRLSTSLLPSMALPGFSSLVRFGNADLLAFYSKLRRTAGTLSRCYGQGHGRQMGAIL
jgi:hypothetical protein